MARTNDHFQFLMGIEPYQYGTDKTLNSLSVSVSYWKGTGFVAHYQAAERKGGCYSVVYDGSRDPLVAAVKVDIEPVSRNNVKRLTVIFESLRLAQEPIAWLFNHRMWDALNKFIAMVGKYGYTEQIKSSILGTIAESEAKIKSLTNNTGTMKLNINANNESANVQNAQVSNAITVAADSKPMAEPIEDAVVEEETADVKNEKQVTIKRKVTLKRKQTEPADEEVKDKQPTLSKVAFSTYTTKKGNVAPQIIGFDGEDDPRWKAHKDAGHKYVSASYRRDLNGNKVYILLFGTKYMSVVKALAGAYNTDDRDAWKRAEDACMAIYEQARRDGKAQWEAKKAQWAEKKAEKKARKAADTTAAENAEKQVAAMLEKLMTGGDVPESILKHIDPEVLAAFKKTA